MSGAGCHETTLEEDPWRSAHVMDLQNLMCKQNLWRQRYLEGRGLVELTLLRHLQNRNWHCSAGARLDAQSTCCVGSPEYQRSGDPAKLIRVATPGVVLPAPGATRQRRLL